MGSKMIQSVSGGKFTVLLLCCGLAHSSIRAGESNRLNKLTSKAGSVTDGKLDSFFKLW